MGVEVVHGSGIPECRVWTVGLVGDFPGTQSGLLRFSCHVLDKPCGAEPPYRVDHVEGDAVEVMGLQDIVAGHEFQ